MPNSASASFSPLELSVAPGGTAVGEMRVANSGPAEHRFTLEVVGASAQWVSISPFALILGPGEGGVARLFVRPPRSPAVPAGPHPVDVRIRSDLDRGSDVVITATVVVEPFHELSATLSPGTGEARHAAYTVTVDNRGNEAARAALSVVDPSHALTVTIVPLVVDAAPGAREQSEVNVVPRRRVVVGRAREHPFKVVVEPDGGTPITLDGSMRQSPVVTRRTLLSIGVVVAAVALFAGVLAAGVFSSSGGAPTRLVAGTGTASCPGADHLAHDANGQVRAKVLEPDNYSFLFLLNGGCLPIRWNPCEPIHYVFNQEFARPADVVDARQAIEKVSQASGLQFTFDGTSTVKARDYQAYQPAVYGHRWAPLLIQWGHQGGGNGLTETVGSGLPIPVDGVYVSGIISINVDAVLPGGAPVPNGFGPGVTFGLILIHELGHVVGLGHVTSITEVMHEPLTDQTPTTSAYGIGDVVGLRLLGRAAGCVTTPPPRAVSALPPPEGDAGSPTAPAHGMPTTSAVGGG